MTEPEDPALNDAVTAFYAARERVLRDYLTLTPTVRDEVDLHARAASAGIRAAVAAVREHDALANERA